jgi:hypothetical protein
MERDVRLAVAGLRAVQWWANQILAAYFDPDQDAADYLMERKELERIAHNVLFAATVLAGFSEAGENLLTPLEGIGNKIM